jgi:tetratricopeptide (TPR) repeat protein
LPGGPPYFAGRRRELAELRADIDRPGLDALRGRPAGTCRVLLVAGRPGSGRTSLALKLARSVAGRYRDGVLFARLTGYDDEPRPAADVAAEILHAMPWRPAAEPAGDPLGALRAAYRGRALVLVLDGAAHAEQVLPLLPAGQDSLVVATAAGPLPGVPDARPCTLGGLDPAAGVDLLAHAVGEIRVTVDPAGARALAEACGGDPAAQRIAAAYLAARPRTPFPEVTRALRERDGGVAARALRLAHDGFGPTTARALRLLALAPDGVADAQVVSALAGTPPREGQEMVLDFTAHGVLHPDPAGYHRVAGWALPALRALLAERERPGEVRLALARMLERNVRLLHACRELAEPAEPHRPGSQGGQGSLGSVRRAGRGAPGERTPRGIGFATRQEAAEWLRRRLPALLAAARAAVADGELDTLARRLIVALLRTLDAYGHAGGPTPERYALHEMLLRIAERRGPAGEKAAALINLADLDMAAGRVKDAVPRYRAALHETRGATDQWSTDTAGRAMEALADAYLELGDSERSADWLGRALTVHQTRGVPGEVARLHGRLGDLHGDHGRFEEALREWRSAAAAHRRMRDLPGYAVALGEVARVQMLAGQPDEALRGSREALRWARGCADPAAERAVLLGLAAILDGLGDPAGARLQREAAAALPEARRCDRPDNR